jgi:hypothetical protein
LILLIIISQGFLLAKPSPISSYDYRRRLSWRKKEIATSQRLISNQSTGITHLPVYTVVFEATTPDAVNSFLTLKESNDITPNKTRIIYDRTYPCTPSDHCVFVFLRPDHFDPTDDDIASWWASMHWAYSIRVLPIARDRPFPEIPPSILCAIVDFAIDWHEPTWKTDILKYGLVQKSWLCVLDLPFLRIGSESKPLHPMSTMSLVRMLTRHPEKGRLITGFKASDFHDEKTESPQESSHIKQNFLTIFGLAPLIKSVELSGHFSRYMISALSVLQGVRRLQLYGGGDRGNWGYVPTIKEIQTLIANWTELREIYLFFWKNSSDEDMVRIRYLFKLCPSKLISIPG